MSKLKKEDNTKNLLKELNLKKEDLIEEIKNDIKEVLYDEISNRVDYESKNKLEKMEKRIYKYKNRSILKRNILILIFLVIIIFETKILYDNNLLFGLSKEEKLVEVDQKLEMNEEKIEEKQKEEIKEKDSSWYIENYSYLLENVKTNLNDENEFYIYEKEYTVDSIKNIIKLNMAYQVLKNEIESKNNVIEVKEEDLKNAYLKIFGNTDDYKGENFNDNCIQFIYNIESENYMAIETKCKEKKEKLFRNIKNIYEEDNKLIIEVFVGLINEEENTLSTIDKKSIYDYSKKNIIKLPIYEFVFQKIEEQYYFVEIK